MFAFPAMAELSHFFFFQRFGFLVKPARFSDTSTHHSGTGGHEKPAHLRETGTPSSVKPAHFGETGTREEPALVRNRHTVVKPAHRLR